MNIHLVLPLTPLLNRYYRKFNNRMVLSADAIAYKAEVAAICHNADIEPLEGDINLIAHVYRKQKSGDIDSYQKGLLDSLQGYAYLNDKQIIELHIYRHDDKYNPRVEVEVIGLATLIDEKAERKAARAMKKANAK